MLKCLMSACGVFLMLVSVADSLEGLRFIRRNDTIPMLLEEFAHYGQKGDKTELVEVQRKGDLIKWKQVVDGVPVYGSVITTRSNAEGKIIRKEGFEAQSPRISDPKPKIPGKEAIDLLRIKWNHIGLHRVDWRLDEPEIYLLPTSDGVNKLVWLASYYVDWKNEAIPEEGYGPVPAYILGIVNAHTGKIERSWNNLQEVNIKAIIGNDHIGKKFHSIDVPKKGNWCWHRDDKKRIEVYNMENRYFLNNRERSSFICERADDTNWDLYSWTEGFSPRNEAFLYATYFVDMWTELVGKEIQPYRGNDTYLELFTHYGDEVDNAKFNGYFFLFGDGKNKFYPLTSLDVICHEIGHAMTMWRGGNMEYFGESGAMNEAYSDVLGETCDMHYKRKTDYLIGEDIMRPGAGKAMRDMCNPSRFGGLDHYKQYNDTINVHYTSGIYNKAWCTLSKTKGWDYIKAFQVFNDANMMYWSSSINMHCGACFVESAAIDLKLSDADVKTAFGVVGVHCSLCKRRPTS